MKKYLSALILGVGAMAMVSSCSNDDIDGLAVEQADGNVEIRLGQSLSSTKTRAAIITKEGEALNLNDIGVFCLAKNIQGINESPQNIVWFGKDASNKTCHLLNNIRANVKEGVVNWYDTNAHYFYPVTQFYNYEFYCNYPYTTNVDSTETTVGANYVINGTQDLIWGRATSNLPFAYSAKFFRQNGGQYKDSIPCLHMRHMLTRLVFKVQPGAKYEIEGGKEEDMDYTLAHTMWIDTLQIIDVNTHLHMNIADYNNLDMSEAARITPTDKASNTLYLRNEEGNIVNSINVPALPSLKQQWGESIMLYPRTQYQIRLVLHDEDPETGKVKNHYVSEVPLYMSQEGGFMQGYSYNITLTVHGPTEITLKADLAPWKEVDGPELDI